MRFILKKYFFSSLTQFYVYYVILSISSRKKYIKFDKDSALFWNFTLNINFSCEISKAGCKISVEKTKRFNLFRRWGHINFPQDFLSLSGLKATTWKIWSFGRLNACLIMRIDSTTRIQVLKGIHFFSLFVR